MQTTNATYNSLFSQNARREVQAIINGNLTYGEGSIISVETSSALFAVDTMSLGGCVAKRLHMRFYPGANRANIPRMASIKLQVRLNDGTTHSDWLEKGTYFIDTRKYDGLSGIMEIEAFDAMLKGEVNFLPSTSTASWPRQMNTVLSECANRIGVSLDSRTSITNYTVQLPMELSIRQVLGYIASANGGNFVITDDNKLRLVKYVDSSASTIDLGNKCSRFTTGEAFQNISRITIDTGVNTDGTMTYYTSGDDTGMTLEFENPWGTQAMANALHTVFSASGVFNYLPFEADSAYLNPAAELGDFITINGTKVMLCSRDINFDALCCMNIEAPSNDEIDHEYPCQTQMERMQQEIKSKVSEGNIISTINQSPESILIQASKVNLSGYVTVSALSGSGTTIINGDNITTGTISADRIDTSDLRAQTVWLNTTPDSSTPTWLKYISAEKVTGGFGVDLGPSSHTGTLYNTIYGDDCEFAAYEGATNVFVIYPGNANVFPMPTNTWYLGSSNYRFKEIWTGKIDTSGNIVISASNRHLDTPEIAFRSGSDHGYLYLSGNSLEFEDPNGNTHTLAYS